MKNLEMIGRIVYALPFLVFGAFHFMNAEGISAYVPSYLPIPIILVYVTGAIFILSSLSILTGKYAGIGAKVLAGQLLVLLLLVHTPNLPDQGSMTNLLKDLGLVGGALMVAGHFYKTGRNIQK